MTFETDYLLSGRLGFDARGRTTLEAPTGTICDVEAFINSIREDDGHEFVSIRIGPLDWWFGTPESGGHERIDSLDQWERARAEMADLMAGVRSAPSVYKAPADE